MGSPRYPEAKELFITADAGGSNGYRSRAWKTELQKLADDFGLTIRVSHFPPGTSKWNKIEHRLFCYITQNWRGRPLRTFETVVQLIGHTRTRKGLRVRAKLDKRKYPTGVQVSDAGMKSSMETGTTSCGRAASRGLRDQDISIRGLTGSPWNQRTTQLPGMAPLWSEKLLLAEPSQDSRAHLRRVEASVSMTKSASSSQ